MNLQEYYSYIQRMPFPTESQFAAFTEHVATAHSWYKHLDLFRGAQVIVFLDPCAGGGFDDEQPRLHHTWKTRGEYVECFGHLAYMWRHGGRPHAGFATDYQLSATAEFNGSNSVTFVNKRETPMLQLPSEIQRECSFRLYPFAVDNGVLLYRFEAQLRAMATGKLDHPCKDLLVALLHASDKYGRASDALPKPSMANAIVLRHTMKCSDLKSYRKRRWMSSKTGRRTGYTPIASLRPRAASYSAMSRSRSAVLRWLR